jgi:hypothetical protein
VIKWFDGLWTFVVGGGAIALLLVSLDPVMRYEECPNYGGNGNASAFDDPNWDLWFPMVLLTWILLVGVEQMLPVTHRNRSSASVAARGLSVFTSAVVVSCCGWLKFAIVCH